MNPDRLLTHFDRIAEAPDAVPRLRRFIWDLAVRGRLVAQDPNDEPASELLKAIREWRKDAMQRKEIRAPRKPLRAIEEDEISYLLPRGWEWARLGEVLYIRSGNGLTTAKMEDGTVPVLATNLKESEKATAQPVISGSKIYPIVVGLPPLAEQQRIVSKVGDLMAVCDQLEAQLIATQTDSRRLLEAVLLEALTPAMEEAP